MRDSAHVSRPMLEGEKIAAQISRHVIVFCTVQVSQGV